MKMKSSILFFFLIVVSGFFLMHHTLNYLPLLSQGDHGRDLYAFWMTTQGALPYKSYWWVYGPLMPFYYAQFLKMLGVSVPSILFGKFLLDLFSGVFIFFTLTELIFPLFAYLATLWFWMFLPNFFFTFNHAGGITMITAIIFCYVLYLNHRRVRYLGLGLLAIFILFLIKLNFGAAMLAVFLAGVALADKTMGVPFDSRKKNFYITALITVPVLVFMIYAVLLAGMPIYEIRQCLPYLRGDEPHQMPLMMAIWFWWNSIALNITFNWPNLLFALVLIAAIFRTMYLIFLPQTDKNVRRRILLAIGFLCAGYVVCLNEYLVSGVAYRIEWSKPFSIILIFLFFGYAMRDFERISKILLFSSLLIVIFQRFVFQVGVVQSKRMPEQYLSMDRGYVITGNDEGWHKTVKDTVDYLGRNLKSDETFFALPYDPLYYYLAARRSPTRQIIFFDHIHIPKEQERSIIIELEAHNTEYVLVSSRMASDERGLGILGVTYCPLLAGYIRNNYKEVASFGDWTSAPGWAWNHGVKILKRNH